MELDIFDMSHLVKLYKLSTFQETDVDEVTSRFRGRRAQTQMEKSRRRWQLAKS